MDLETRKERDLQVARKIKAAAEEEYQKSNNEFELEVDWSTGKVSGLAHASFLTARTSSLQALINYEDPFQAMAEVKTKNLEGRQNTALWYANTRTECTIIFKDDKIRSIVIVPWTHAGLQIALSNDLNTTGSLNFSGLNLTEVTPTARAKFQQVLPSIKGVYEPGGMVKKQTRPIKTGLKAVKLYMTPQQVQAFIAGMRGLMLITGAPGSGKTTVAMQRVRFLLDQNKDPENKIVPPNFYTLDRIAIFLANENMLTYAQQLMVHELRLPMKLAKFVPEYIATYLKEAWKYKLKARQSTKRARIILNVRARDAFFNLCDEKHLQNCWKIYMNQIITRLQQFNQSDWMDGPTVRNKEIRENLKAFSVTVKNIAALKEQKSVRFVNPYHFEFTMDRLFLTCKTKYINLRKSLSVAERNKFDTNFAQWLYWVYDPLDCLEKFFKENIHQGKRRIKEGTGGRINEERVIEAIYKDWEKRIYNKEEIPWLALLLRLVLPENDEKFAEIPGAFTGLNQVQNKRFSHIVLDEAQDLSAPEAALLASFVDPDGALTVSADTRQTVSPVHGIEDLEPIKFGSAIAERGFDMQFPFSVNLRQSKQISDFLQAFYFNVFREPAPFNSSDRLQEIKPQLYRCPASEFSGRIRQLNNVIQRSKDIDSVIVLQINEDREALEQLYEELKEKGVSLAPIWKPFFKGKQLMLSSVERVKGLEFDCCIILGLDNVEAKHLKYTKNRAYVALSRASRRLVMLCEDYPPMLRGISQDCFDTF